MGLFKADLYRAFAVGFLIGGAAIVTSIGADSRAGIIANLFS